MINKLWVVMPVYNEQDCIEQVTVEWLNSLRAVANGFVFCVLNDGSTDNTAQILDALAAQNPELKIINKTNTGHGQTCVLGYKTAIENSAQWVLQIDSDGQCDPKFLAEFIALSTKYKLMYGFRKTRDDGGQRWLVSRVVSFFVFAATGVWVRDANVPYRLMHQSTLVNVLPCIPANFYLANILVAVLQQKQQGIKWINIHFRERMGGVPSVKTFTFAKHGIKLYKQLRRAIKQHN
jgi:dolichol-phosphate mannosyltransferase